MIMGVPTPSRTLPQDTRGRGEGENRRRKERNKGGEERRGLKTLTRRYPATQGRRILMCGALPPTLKSFMLSGYLAYWHIDIATYWL